RQSIVYSDNGTNFDGAENLFSKINWTQVEETAKVKQIKWIFNPPTAAWWGGFWERLIRSVKDLLKRMLGHGKLDYVRMETCLCEAEAIMNSRPLTHITEDPLDLIPLTPGMFLKDNVGSNFLELDSMDGGGMRKQ